MKDTNVISQRTEAQVLAALSSLGYVVLTPFGVARYDLVVDTPYGFKKIQCKTGRIKDGVVKFYPYSVVKRDGSYQNLDYKRDADYFGIYCPDNSEVYVVPVELVSGTNGSLRLEPAKNGQKSGILWAKDYKVFTPCRHRFADPVDLLKRELEDIRVPVGADWLFSD